MAPEPGLIERWRRAEEALAKLERIRGRAPTEATYRGDSDLRDVVERNFQVAIEAGIDLANEMIAARGWRTPATSREAFDVLAEGGVFTAAEAQRMYGWVGFRNLLVHGYARVDPAVVVEILVRELADLRGHLVRLAAAGGCASAGLA